MRTEMNMKNRNIIAVMISALLMLTVAGCRSQKNGVVADPGASGGSVAIRTASDMSGELKKIVDGYGSWKRLRVPVTISLSSPKSISISGTAIMERNKSVMFTLKYFGFEIGSLYIEGDSITIVDKIHKSYVSENVRGFMSGFDISVSNVQDLLFGRLFIVGSDDAGYSALKRCEMEIVDSDQWLLIPKAPSSNASYGFKFSPADILSALICQTGKNPPVTCTYQTPVSTVAGAMSPSVSLDYQKGKSTVKASFEWNFKKARWDNDVELRRPSIGKDYKRLSSTDISKMIQKL